MYILLFDIGNTSIKIGLDYKAEIKFSINLPTKVENTVDSFGFLLDTFLKKSQVTPNDIEACVVSSVVPSFDGILKESIIKYIGSNIYFVPEDISVPMKNHYSRPFEVGTDRLVAAFAARRKFSDYDSVIIVDFGTAVTFDCVSKEAYLGGLIFPGPNTAINALSNATAKLPYVNLQVDSNKMEIGKDTTTSIKHGVIFGFISLVEGLIERLKNDFMPNALIVGTGNFVNDINKINTVFDKISRNLVLEGLSILYYEYIGKKKV